MKTFRSILIATLALGLGGCQSLTRQIDAAIPEGAAKKVSGTITGKFSATSIEAEDVVKDDLSVKAGVLHVRHSNAWVPLIELHIEGYERARAGKEKP